MEKLKFLFISFDNLSGDVAWHIMKEGHEVKFHVKSQDKDVGEGFLEFVEDYKQYIDWADVIVFDDTLGEGKEADELRKKGKLVVGASIYTDRLEDDRDFGQEEMRKKNISILPYKTFTSFDEGIEFIRQNPAEYVLKPTDDTPENTLGMLYIGFMPKGEDVIDVIKGYKRSMTKWQEGKHYFQLQKKVKGVEVAVGAFFNGKKFLRPINVNFEHKRLFPGDIGPDTGEMGTSMFWAEKNKIFDLTLAKFEEELKNASYVGYMDINCIVNEDGMFPLEFTSRFGYPTISIQIDSFDMPVGEFFYRLAKGEDFKLKVKKGFHIGVRLAVPPFPFHDQVTYNAKSKGSEIHLMGGDEGLHIEDVALKEGKWYVSGTSGVIMVVCGSGIDMHGAMDQAYSRIKNIHIPRMYYRNDIGKRWHEDEKKLKAWGYIESSIVFEELNHKNFPIYRKFIKQSEEVYPEEFRTDIEEYEDIICNSENELGIVALVDGEYAGNAIGCDLMQAEREDFDQELKKINEKIEGKNSEIIYMYNILIERSHQSKGYGIELMKEFVKKAKERGFRQLVGHFRKNGSYSIVKKLKPNIELEIGSWEGSDEDFVLCVVDISKF